MNMFVLSLAVCIVSAQSVLSRITTGGSNLGYNQFAPTKNIYGYTNGQTYSVGNSAYNMMNTQGSPTVHGGNYGYQSNTKNSAMAYNNHYNINTKTASANGRNYNQNSAMAYLPFMMGGLDANELATYSMMMNSGSNNVVPYLMMNGENTGLMRMMALRRASRGGRRLSPYMMSMLFGMEL